MSTGGPGRRAALGQPEAKPPGPLDQAARARPDASRKCGGRTQRTKSGVAGSQWGAMTARAHGPAWYSLVEPQARQLEDKEGYTTTKLRLPAAAPPQPRVRLRRAEVPANDLRRERDARLQGYDGHDRDSRRVHVLALQQILEQRVHRRA